MLPRMEGRYRAAPADQGGGTGAEDGGTRRGTARYSVPEAARALGISERAVRKRITAGTLDAEKDGTAWAVFLPVGTRAEPAAAPAAPAVPGAVPRAAPEAAPGGTDLRPLAELIERQGEEIRRLAAAATLWQERARVLEGRLLALGAGDAVPASAPTARPEAAGAADRMGPAASAPASRWRRWFRRVVEGP